MMNPFSTGYRFILGYIETRRFVSLKEAIYQLRKEGKIEEEKKLILDGQSRWIENVDLFTFVVCIEKAYFEMEELPRRIPIRIGIGTYQHVLEEESLEIPETASSFPKGRYVSFFLEVEDLYMIGSEQLDEIRLYLKEHGLRPVSDTTAYLYRVTYSETGYLFQFCVRLRVEDAEP